MKTSTKKEAKKSITLSISSNSVLDKAIEVLNKEEEKKGKTRYELKANINAQEFKVEGNDMEVFNKLPRQLKFVTKGIFTLTNKETKKSFEIVYPPFLARKLYVNPFVQTVQWKRLSAKVD